MRSVAALAAIGMCVSASANLAFAGAARPLAQAAPARRPLLDVPFVAQTEALCGGAAAAMVMRYWGEASATAEQFAPLVDRDAGGIATGALTDALARKGWPTVVITPDALDSQIGQGRPVIALLEVRPKTYHYVVVVGTTTDRVIVHDPAKNPFQVWPREAFDRASKAAAGWMVVVQSPGSGVRSPGSGVRSPGSGVRSPGSGVRSPETGVRRSGAGVVAAGGGVSSSEAGVRSAAVASACAPLVADAVKNAKAGHRDEADTQLASATALCPDDPAGWRERAGLAFAAKQYAQAADWADRAVGLDGRDEYTRQLAATSHFMAGQSVASLRAWQSLHIAKIDITGTTYTAQPVVLSRSGLTVGGELTPNGLLRAAHRLEDVPSLSSAVVRFDPRSDGSADVTLAVDERSRYPGLLDAALAGGRAVFAEDLPLSLSPFGQGERIDLLWGFADHRHRVSADLQLPAPSRVPGLIELGAMVEHEAFAAGSDSFTAAVRTRGYVGLSDWATSFFRWRGVVSLDRFDDLQTVGLTGSADVRAARDHVSLTPTATIWWPTSSSSLTSRFASYGVSVAALTAESFDRPRLIASGAWHRVSDTAPLMTWLGADSNFSTTGTLRAHPLISDNVVDSPVFGRELAAGSVEYQRPFFVNPHGTAAWAVFLDAARAARTIDDLPRGEYNIGAGIRVSVGHGSAFRLDAAWSPARGRGRLSVGYAPDWLR